MTGEFRIETAGAVIEDLEVVDGNILVLAPNVTLRRVLVTGGTIFNQGNRGCNSGLAVEDTTIQPMPGQVFDKTWVLPAIGPGGYTARRVAIDGLPEGFRVSGASAGCGPVVIEDSFARVRPPEPCDDWHGDTLQGYDAPALTIRNSVLIIDDTSTCGGTAAFFYPANHGNQPFDVDQLVVQGGGYPMRTGVPGRVRGLMIVEDSWAYGPIDVNCSAILEWTATIVKLEPGGQPRVVRQLPCAT